ncbi:hypothetical protein V6N13_092696 [Hibiscus sabdariffa]
MLVPNDEAKEVESGATKVFDESSLKTNSEFVRPMILVSEEAVDVGSKNKSGEMVVQEGLLMEDLFDMSYRDASESQQLILVVALISAFNHWELMNETGAGS